MRDIINIVRNFLQNHDNLAFGVKDTAMEKTAMILYCMINGKCPLEIGDFRIKCTDFIQMSPTMNRSTECGNCECYIENGLYRECLAEKSRYIEFYRLAAEILEYTFAHPELIETINTWIQYIKY